MATCLALSALFNRSNKRHFHISVWRRRINRGLHLFLFCCDLVTWLTALLHSRPTTRDNDQRR